MRKSAIIFAAITFFALSCKKDTTEPPATSTFDCNTVTYSGTIASLATSRCNASGCHNSGSGNGDFTAYAGLKAKFDNGSLRQRVLVEESMPQGGSLTDEQYKQFECWINAGAPNN
ncbi:MAG: hypothetical protein JNL72_14020 [Flavipsychrobacter sp.]|nr:hypothetical protein [Flavipsychrobacter sp.]